MAKTKVKKLTVDREDLAEALHVALRKCCDSTPTTLLWIIIHKLDTGVWCAYLDHVWTELQFAVRNGDENFTEVVKKASMGFEQSISANRNVDRHKIDWYSVSLLDICFDMMNENDWVGYTEYIND